MTRPTALDDLATELQRLLDVGDLPTAVELDLLQAAAELGTAGALPQPVPAGTAEGSLDRVRSALLALPADCLPEGLVDRVIEHVVAASTRAR